tara:strand:- start:172 stop:522 length:351 start_codon:yes stop_codon:yes gene_type:complete
MPIIHLTNQIDIMDYKDQYNKILFHFSASWCGPCKRITPLIKSKMELLDRSDVLYLYIDVDAHKALSTQFAIKSIPTFAVYNKEKDHITETLTTSDIQKLSEYCIHNGIPVTSSNY